MKTPGPGTYNPKQLKSTTSQKFLPENQKEPKKFLADPIFEQGKASFLMTPAPGEYEQPSCIKKDKKWVNSKF